MTVKILIKRTVPENKSEALSRLLRSMRVLTMSRPGYITGETLVGVDTPGQTLVISTWASADAWRQWLISEERRQLQEKIDDLLGEPTTYEIYEHR